MRTDYDRHCLRRLLAEDQPRKGHEIDDNTVLWARVQKYSLKRSREIAGFPETHVGEYLMCLFWEMSTITSNGDNPRFSHVWIS